VRADGRAIRRRVEARVQPTRSRWSLQGRQAQAPRFIPLVESAESVPQRHACGLRRSHAVVWAQVPQDTPPPVFWSVAPWSLSHRTSATFHLSRWRTARHSASWDWT